MAFWDGRRWTPLQPAADPQAKRAGSRRRDWIATFVMLMGLAAVIVPYRGTQGVGPELGIAPAWGLPGQTVELTGAGFVPRARLQMTWDDDTTSMPQVNVSKTGTLRARFEVPISEGGSHEVAAVSVDSPGNGHRQQATGSLGVELAAVAFNVRAPDVDGSSSTPPVAPSVSADTTGSPSASPGTSAPRPSATATPPPYSSTSASPTPVPTFSPMPHLTPQPTSAPTVAPTVAPTPAPTPDSGVVPKLIFGLGPTVDGSRNAPLVQDTPARLLSAWYNGPGDVGWATDGYHQSMYDQEYAKGRAIHLIVWSGDGEATFPTSYGTACGRPYPLSDRFLGDMQQLAVAFAGSGQLFVTLFTEFQTFACNDNSWIPNQETNAYWRALKDRYMATLDVFHQHAPGSKVSLGWGGWQMRWDDPGIGGGRSMMSHFADVMAASDFQSFQAMQSDGNINDVRAMVSALNDYGPVMLAHYKPDNGSRTTFDSDVTTMLTDDYLSEMTRAGLFAWSFMDDSILSSSQETYVFVRDAVRRYGH